MTTHEQGEITKARAALDAAQSALDAHCSMFPVDGDADATMYYRRFVDLMDARDAAEDALGVLTGEWE